MANLTDMGAALVDARRASGLTQAQLADTLGVKRQQVQRWEATGYRSASLERVSRAAAALGFDAVVIDRSVHLSRGGGEMPAPTAAAIPGAARPVADLGEIVARVRVHGDELRDRYGVRRIGVFGSFAAASQSASSDIDMLVDGGERGAFGELEAAGYLERILGREVDAESAEALRPEVRDEILREVVVVWAA
jgi:uncharacterized protein